MSMKTKEQLFAGETWYGLHDVIVDTLDIQPTKVQAMTLFDKLPERLQEIAFTWGLNDTVFLDETYEAITENRIKIDEGTI